MPITPNAPDYVGQVRGIIEDLRNNYLKKQQLYLQEQDQAGRLALGYANMQQQSALARDQLAASMRQHEASAAAQMAGNRAEQYKATAALADKQAKADLDERKFGLELWKEQNKLEQEQRERDQETNSGRLMQEGTIALNSDDPTKLIEWTNKLAGSILTQKQRNDVYTNALSLVDTKKKLEQDGINIRSQPQALQIVQDMNMMNVENLSPDELAARMDEHTAKFKGLKNTDPKINDIFMSVSQDVAKRQHDFRQKEYGQVFDSFLRSGELAQLDQKTQDQFDTLQADYPEGPSRASNDYSIKLKRLMFQSNNANSNKTLDSLNRQAITIQENIVSQNPSLAAVKTDPSTGEKYRTFPYSPPDLSPVIGFNGTIDPDTGLVNKSTTQQYQKWLAEVTSPSFLLGQVPFIRGLNIGAPVSQPTKGSTESASALPFRPANAYKSEMVAAPGTAVIPTAPGTPRVQISEDTIAKVVNLYNTNPDALVSGKPVKEIVARLLSTGISLPGLRQTPERNVVIEGQNR